MCSQVLDELNTTFIKSNANLVINITCVLLYLSRALYIFECINLSVQDLFLGELFVRNRMLVSLRGGGGELGNLKT
jgi:hypothetical protein